MKFKKLVKNIAYFKKINRLCCSQIFIALLSIGLIFIIESSIYEFINKKYDDMYGNVIYNKDEKRYTFDQIFNYKSKLDIELINKKINTKIIDYDFYIQDSSSFVLNNQITYIHTVYCDKTLYCAQRLTNENIKIHTIHESEGVYISKRLFKEYFSEEFEDDLFLDFYPKHESDFYKSVKIKGYYEFENDKFISKNEYFFIDHLIFNSFEEDFNREKIKFSLTEIFLGDNDFKEEDINTIKHILPASESRISKILLQSEYFNKMFTLLKNIFMITLVVMFIGIVFTFYIKTNQEKNIMIIKKTYYQKKTSIVLEVLLINTILYFLMIFLVFLILLLLQCLYYLLFGYFYTFNPLFYYSIIVFYFGVIIGSFSIVFIIRKNNYEKKSYSI